MKHWYKAASLVLAMACGGDDATGPVTNDDFAPELGVDLNAMTQTASGLYLLDVVVGGGEEGGADDLLTVAFEGWLADGTPLDQSASFAFTPSDRLVIQGWVEGVPGMRVGGTRRLVIPPSLAWGQNGSPPNVPPNATVVFDIDLLSVGAN